MVRSKVGGESLCELLLVAVQLFSSLSSAVECVVVDLCSGDQVLLDRSGFVVVCSLV